MICRLVRCGLVFLALFLWTAALLPAQDTEKAPRPAKSDSFLSVEAADVPPAKPDRAAEQPPKTTSPEPENLAVWVFQSSGFIGWLLLGMSFLTVGLTVQFMLEMRRHKVIPPELVSEFENKIKEKKYQEAYEIARNNPSFLGKVLAAGLSRLSTGYPQAIEAMHEVGEDESMRLEHRLSWLAILGTTGPLLGLLGTVFGIIESFRVIARAQTQPNPQLLARGISTSLCNTFEGLAVAIIATVAFLLLKNQAARLVLEVGMISGNLMSRFSSLVRATPGLGSSSQTESG